MNDAVARADKYFGAQVPGETKRHMDRHERRVLEAVCVVASEDEAERNDSTLSGEHGAAETYDKMAEHLAAIVEGSKN